jgi:C4-dicarboxylate-specific signal transduction histidine kinase
MRRLKPTGHPMHDAASRSKACEILDSLDDLLTQEAQALIRLDAETVKSLAHRKLELTSTLADCDRQSLREQQPRLTKLRSVLRNNLVLLAHAREHVTVTIRTLKGGPPVIEPPHTRVNQATRLDVKG